MLFSPQDLSARSPAAQFDDLDYSTQAIQPKSLFSPGKAAHEASAAQFEELNCSTLHPISYPTQTLKLGHVAKKLMRIMKNSTECSSKDESDEIKNIH